jgi:SAM-dependent methyltransferase
MTGESLRAIFDQDAEAYDRARPGYPASLIRDLGTLAEIGPGARVAEIGPGTGQATLALAGGGAQVVAVELGPSLAARLLAKVGGLPIEVIVSAFEEWPLPVEPFDTVAAFTAWHWLDPDLRGPKSYAALRPGGTLVTVTATHILGGTEQFFADVQNCYVRWDPATPPGLQLAAVGRVPPATDEIDELELFDPADRHRYQQDVRYTTREYLDLLSTYSGHRALRADRRAGLFACVGHLIDTRYDGSVTKRYLYELRVARRRVGA